MSEAQWAILVAVVSLAGSVITVIYSYSRDRAFINHEKDRLTSERQERDKRDADFRMRELARMDRESHERTETRRIDWQIHTIERFQDELVKLRSDLIWYRDTCATLEDSSLPYSTIVQEYKARFDAFVDTGGALKNLTSRVEDEQLRTFFDEFTIEYEIVLREEPAPERYDLANNAVSMASDIRVYSGGLLQELQKTVGSWLV